MVKSILVDGREFVLGRRTGIGRFLEGLLLALSEVYPDWRMVIVMDEALALPESLQDKVDTQQTPKYLEWHWPSLAQGFDLFLSPYPKRPIRKLSCPSIHTIHDVFYLTHPAYQGNSLRRMAGLWRLKQAVSSANLTWFDSRVSQDETKKLVGDITHDVAIRFPAIEQSFKPDRRVKKKDFFLFVGNGLPHKNIKILLGAIKGTGIHLKCVGIRQDVADKLLHMFQPEEGQVEFLQGVDDVALLKLYRQCKALLQPSTAEGYGYPPQEAFACGTPAIVSDIPVLRETTGGFANYCPPHDAQAWCNALTTFEADAKMIKQDLAWAQSHQGKQGWNHHIQDIEKLVGLSQEGGESTSCNEAKGTHDSWGIDEVDTESELRRLYGMSGSLVIKHAKQVIMLLDKNAVSLEVGSGLGKMSFYPALMGVETHLLDSSSSALKAADVLYKSCDMKVCKVEADALAIQDSLHEKFQLSLSLGVNEHFSGQSRQQIFNTHYDVLIPSGYTVIAVPNRHCLSYRIAMLMWKITDRWPKGLYEYGFSKSELQAKMKKAGFVDVKVYSGSYAKEDFAHFILGNFTAALRKFKLIKQGKGRPEESKQPSVEDIRVKFMEQSEPERFVNHQSYTWIAIGKRSN